MTTTAAGEAEHLLRDADAHCLLPMAARDDAEAEPTTVYVRGEGLELTDIHGRDYLDMMSSHTRANSLGYGNAEIARAVAEQLDASLCRNGQQSGADRPSRWRRSSPSWRRGGCRKVLFVSGGSEAVEAAIKLAKQYQRPRGANRAPTRSSRAGTPTTARRWARSRRTDWLGTRHVSEPRRSRLLALIPGPSRYRNPFGMEEEAYAAFCADYLERQIQHEGPDYVAAFIAEPIMQAHGVQIPPRQLLGSACARSATSYGVLLIVDEVITGFGRTGAWFASEHYGIEPDIMTMAKALTAGYMPMGAVIARPEIVDALPIFRHVHTFSGHAGAAAAANTAIAHQGARRPDRAGARRTATTCSTPCKEALEPHPIVGQVRGHRHVARGRLHRRQGDAAPFEDDTVAAVVRRMYDHGVHRQPDRHGLRAGAAADRDPGPARPRRRRPPPAPCTRWRRSAGSPEAAGASAVPSARAFR